MLKKPLSFIYGLIILILAAGPGWGAISSPVEAQSPSPSAITDWYISPGGNDISGNGSEARPLRHIQTAINRASPGNRLHILPGTYSENLDINKDLILTGESVSPEDIAVEGRDVGPLIRVGAVKCSLNNLTVRNSRGDGIFMQDVWRSDETTPTAELALKKLIVKNNSGHGIDSLSGGSLSVEDCDISSNTGDGIYLEQTGFILKNNRVHDNSGYGINVITVTFPDSPAGTIEQNQIKQNKSGGVREHSCNQAIIKNNEIVNNPGTGITLSWGDAQIVNNLIRDNQGAGIGGDGVDIKITGNTIEGCSGEGIRLVDVWGDISSNIIGNNSGAGLVLGKGQVNIENNLIVKNQQEGISTSLLGGRLINNTVAYNNGGVRIDASLVSSIIKVVNDIICYNGWDYDCTMNASSCDLGSGNLSGEKNISKEPLFVDPAKGDYHLLPGSPCIDAGTNEDAPLADLEGAPRPFNMIADMGCYEYTPQLPPLDERTFSSSLG